MKFVGVHCNIRDSSRGFPKIERAWQHLARYEVLLNTLLLRIKTMLFTVTRYRIVRN